MTTVLVGTDSVHTTAAACDYLGPRLDSDDTVYLCSIPDSQVSERDAGDAGNVARTRLIEPTVEILDPGSLPERETISGILRQLADEYDADVIVIGANRGDPETAGESPGSTVRQVLSETERPVIVVPV